MFISVYELLLPEGYSGVSLVTTPVIIKIMFCDFFRRLNDPAFTSHFPAILVKPITFECRNLLPLFINDQREEVCYDCLYVVLFLFYCMVIKTLCCFVLTLMTLLYSFESIILQKSMLFSVEVNFTPSFPTYLSPCKKNTHRHTYVLPLLTSRP